MLEHFSTLYNQYNSVTYDLTHFINHNLNFYSEYFITNRFSQHQVYYIFSQSSPSALQFLHFYCEHLFETADRFWLNNQLKYHRLLDQYHRKMHLDHIVGCLDFAMDITCNKHTRSAAIKLCETRHLWCNKLLDFH